MEDIIQGVLNKTVPFDVLLEIILKLPGSSVINLCLSNKNFYAICNRYQERIYDALLKKVFTPFCQLLI